MRLWIMSAVLGCGVFGGTVARAQDAGEVAFAAGQFTGAAIFCGLPRPEVMALAKAMLDVAGVDSGGPSPEMTRFTQGVTAGTVEMKDKAPATCDEVKEGFKQMQTKVQ